MNVTSRCVRKSRAQDVEEEGFQVFPLRLFGTDFSSFSCVLILMCDLERQKEEYSCSVALTVLEGRTSQKSVVMATVLESGINKN